MGRLVDASLHYGMCSSSVTLIDIKHLSYRLIQQNIIFTNPFR